MLLSPKQREFVKYGTHRWNFKGGATRSGKTYLDFRWIIPIRIRERIGKDGLAVILGVTKSTIERNVLEPMRNLYGDMLVGTISSDNTAWIFGEKCYCLGAEKVSQVSKIRGASIKYCYGDEVADWSEEVFALLKSRLDKEYSCFDGTFNPQYPDHWLKKFLDSNADIFSQTYTIDDNPFLPESFKENLKKEYEGTTATFSASGESPRVWFTQCLIGPETSRVSGAGRGGTGSHRTTAHRTLPSLHCGGNMAARPSWRKNITTAGARAGGRRLTKNIIRI